MPLPPVGHPGPGSSGLSPSARRVKVAVVVVWVAGIIGSLLLWSYFRQPANLPADGSWAERLLNLLMRVRYDDPALVQRVHVSRIAVILSLACLGLLGYLERERVTGAIIRYFTAPSHPINLAIFRIVVFWQAYSLGWFDFIASIVDLPQSMQEPPLTGIPAVGPLAALARWPVNPLGPAEVLFLGKIMKAACITGMLGLCTRISSLVTAFIFFFGWGAAQWYGKIDHHHHILWFLLVLAASRSGDALSLDSLVRAWRRGRGGNTEPPEPSVAYGLPLRMCILLMGVIYFFPGFWKIFGSGFDWFLSDSPFNQMYLKWYMLGGWLPSVRPDRFPLLIHAGALGTILFELSFIFLIFGRRTIFLPAVLGVTFHTSLNFFMRHSFETLRNSYAVFVNWHRGLAWTGRRLFRRALIVRFNGRDRRIAPLIACARSLDWLEAVVWQDGAEGVVEVHAGGEVWRSGAACKRIALRLPLFWPLSVPLQALPDRWLERGAPVRESGSIRTGPSRLNQRPPGLLGPLLVGTFLVVGNGWTGVNRMQKGWPLACYPLFDGLIGESYISLRIVAVDSAGAEKVLVPDDYRRVYSNNWSNVLQRLLNEPDQARRSTLLRTVWEILEKQEPGLHATRIVKFYTVRSSIRPELWHRPPSDPELILTIRL